MPRSSTSKFKAGFTYNHIKQYGQSPAAKDVPGLHAWGTDKYYKMSADNMRGVLPKGKKVTMTEQTMKTSKKNDFPGAKYAVDEGFKLTGSKARGNRERKSLYFQDEAEYFAQ